jgi:hypothetical protein
MTTTSSRTTMAALGLTIAATVLTLGTTSPADARSGSGHLTSIDDIVAFRHLQQSEDLLTTGLIEFR